MSDNETEDQPQEEQQPELKQSEDTEDDLKGKQSQIATQKSN